MHGVVTIPNAVSFVRLLLIPVFVWLVLIEQTAWAGVLLGFIGATDWIDGYLARRLDQVSEVGKMLDPIADRLAVAVAVVLGLIVGVLPPWFAWAIIVREVVIGIGAAYGWMQRRSPARRSLARQDGHVPALLRRDRLLRRRRPRLAVVVVGLGGTRRPGPGVVLHRRFRVSRGHAHGDRGP